MICKGYHITLVRLRHQDIEMVRKHRNADHIRRYMSYREIITPEMQENWFKKIDTIHNNYFVIYVDDQPCGLIYGAEIDWENKETGNGGIFIWEERYWQTDIPLRASLLLTDLSLLFGLERTYIKVLKENIKAIAYNKNLGYEILPGEEEKELQKFVLTKSNYLKKCSAIRNVLREEYAAEKIQIIPDDMHHPVTSFLVEKYRQQPEANKLSSQLIIA